MRQRIPGAASQLSPSGRADAAVSQNSEGRSQCTIVAVMWAEWCVSFDTPAARLGRTTAEGIHICFSLSAVGAVWPGAARSSGALASYSRVEYRFLVADVAGGVLGCELSGRQVAGIDSTANQLTKGTVYSGGGFDAALPGGHPAAQSLGCEAASSPLPVGAAGRVCG